MRMLGLWPRVDYRWNVGLKFIDETNNIVNVNGEDLANILKNVFKILSSAFSFQY